MELINKNISTSEEEIIEKLGNSIDVTYKFYDINFNNEVINSVNTIEEAEETVNRVKEDKQNNNLQLSIIEKYSQNIDEVKTTSIDVAKNNIETKIFEIEEKHKDQKQQETNKNLSKINGVKLSYIPVKGTVSSRYASTESVRNFRKHSGLDIAAPKGTEIKAVAAGTVISADIRGGYGNLVRLNHGNDVETYYGHCSKLLVKKGQYVEPGEVIALVGSTGNSTGPHLHFEIRINSRTVNPQEYLYK